MSYKSRQEIEESERRVLAPYAQKSGDSRGRRHGGAPHDFRTEFQRDRARIIHSKAFRRLEYKTQVFLNGTGDHLRTRLTHSIEVASISRTIARALSLNEDLAEAIALAHDLGHSPFGHSGEEMLATCMAGHGGFDHNLQSLRVVELLESSYPGFPGLNLTYEVLEGLQKHRQSYEPLPGMTGEYRQPSLEAQVADLADEITYYSHDLDDALDFQILNPTQLDEVEVWQRSSLDAARTGLREPDLHKRIIRDIIDLQVRDVVTSSGAAIAEAAVDSADAARFHERPLVSYSASGAAANRDLRQFLYRNVYYHPRVAEVNARACEMLRKVFEKYVSRPQLLGEGASRRVEAEGLHRTVCDYIAGMTDRYLMEEYGRLTSDA